ncbi:MAG: hypothetical protein OXI83_19225 [Gemmatimonadota bacterium]|nr:hypothetical protein [Gemmatimonadota bacterium]
MWPGCVARRTRALPVHLLCTVLILGVASACRTWQPATMSPERLIATERPERVRVTVPGGATVTLRNPIVVNDSIVAAVAPDPGGPFATARPGVPTAAVEGLEVSRFSRARTVAMGVGIVAMAFGWARFAGSNSSGEPPVDPPLEKDGFRPHASGGFRIIWRFPW